MSVIINFIDIILFVLTWVIIIRVVLTWFKLRPDSPLMMILYEITEPILSPLRNIVPRTGTIDITPMVAIIVLFLIIAPLHIIT